MTTTTAAPTIAPITHCAEQQPGESLIAYQYRVLRYALTCGADPLTRSQLEHADTAAQQTVCALPGKTLDPDQARIDATIHRVRLRIAGLLEVKRAQLNHAQRLLDALYTRDDQEETAPGQPSATQEDDATRAARLLRAALTLIMQPPSNGQGGGGAQRSPLIPPAPRTPPSDGHALSTPGRPTGRF